MARRCATFLTALLVGALTLAVSFFGLALAVWIVTGGGGR